MPLKDAANGAKVCRGAATIQYRAPRESVVMGNYSASDRRSSIKMTGNIPVNRNRRRMAEFNARKSAESMQRKPANRVEQALKAPDWRTRPGQETQCMPDVALYFAGYRTKRTRITCTGRQKVRGRSIPLV